MPANRAFYVIEYDPDNVERWLVMDRRTDSRVTAFVDFDDALVLLRELRGDVAVGDLA